MIEIEQHFVIDEAARERLISGATFLGEVQNHDTYYDTTDYSLTTHDMWLRARNGSFELKIGCNEAGQCDNAQAVRYEEIEDEDVIRRKIGLVGPGSFLEDVTAAGYVVYGQWIITRTKYRKGEFTIDFDSVDFGYELVEIELMVEEGCDLAAAAARVSNFAQHHGLVVSQVRGKNSEYLRRHQKTHFSALVAAGVLPPEK